MTRVQTQELSMLRHTLWANTDTQQFNALKTKQNGTELQLFLSR